MEIKRFSVKIATWANDLIIRAYDENDAVGLARVLFKIPSDIEITATLIIEEEAKNVPSMD